MAEYRWGITINGVEHYLFAENDKRGSGYILYDGDDYVANILPYKLFSGKLGIEQDFYIDGERLTFIRLKYEPDIVRDGVLVNGNVPYTEELKSFCVSESVGWVIRLLILVLWNLHSIAKYGLGNGRFIIPIISIPLLLLMVYELAIYIRSLRRLKNDGS